MYKRDFRFKKTNLTDEFTFQDFKQRYGPDYVLMFVVDNGKLLVQTSDTPLSPEKGQTLIALVHSTENSEQPEPIGKKAVS